MNHPEELAIGAVAVVATEVHNQRNDAMLRNHGFVPWARRHWIVNRLMWWPLGAVVVAAVFGFFYWWLVDFWPSVCPPRYQRVHPGYSALVAFAPFLAVAALVVVRSYMRAERRWNPPRVRATSTQRALPPGQREVGPRMWVAVVIAVVLGLLLGYLF